MPLAQTFSMIDKCHFSVMIPVSQASFSAALTGGFNIFLLPEPEMSLPELHILLLLCRSVLGGGTSSSMGPNEKNK